MKVKVNQMTWQHLFALNVFFEYFVHDICDSFNIGRRSRKRRIHVVRYGAKRSAHFLLTPEDYYIRENTIFFANFCNKNIMLGYRTYHGAPQYWICDGEKYQGMFSTALEALKDYYEYMGEDYHNLGIRAEHFFHFSGIQGDSFEEMKERQRIYVPLRDGEARPRCFECGKPLEKSRFHEDSFVRLCNKHHKTYRRKKRQAEGDELFLDLTKKSRASEPQQNEELKVEENVDVPDEENLNTFDGAAIFSLRSIINFITLWARCRKCDQPLAIEGMAGTKNTTRGLQFKCPGNCRVDKDRLILRCDDELRKTTSPIGVRFSTSIIFNGLSFTDANALLSCAGVEMPIAESTFYGYQEKFEIAIARSRNEAIDANIQELEDQDIRMAVDGRWSSRRQALEGTVTAFNVAESPPRVIGVTHVIQDRRVEARSIGCVPGDPRTWMYTGPSKRYEGFGVKQICKTLKATSCRVHTLVRDGDSSTGAVVRSEYPQVEEINDFNHLIKNIPKAVNRKRQEDGYSELRGEGDRIQRQFRRMMAYIHSRSHMSPGEKRDRYRRLVEASVEHFGGDHSDCITEDQTAVGKEWEGLGYVCPIAQVAVDTGKLLHEMYTKTELRSFNVPKLCSILENFDLATTGKRQELIQRILEEVPTLIARKLIRSREVLEWLHHYFMKMVETDACLVRGSTNVCESINALYARKAPKHRDWRSSYAARCDVALMIYMKGYKETFAIVADKLGVPINGAAIKYLDAADAKRQAQKAKASQQESKVLKALAKVRKRRMLTRDLNDGREFTYKPASEGSSKAASSSIKNP